MPPVRLLLLFNEPVLPLDHPDSASERDVLETLDAMGGILDDAGFEVIRFGLGPDLTRLHEVLADKQPDVVFNLFEGLADRPFTESVAAGVMEWYGVPFTGSSADSLSLCRDKRRSKYLLQGAKLPTSPFFMVDRLPVPVCPFDWPAIVKPAQQDASVGIHQASVVTNQEQLECRVSIVLKEYGPALVEQFIAGREFQISLVEVGGASHELIALPLAEITFNDPAFWPIYSYDAKWDTNSAEYKSAPMVMTVTAPEEWQQQMVDIAKRAHRLHGCRDYSRVDLRMTADGRPFVLEVNPNPFINSIALVDGLAKIGSDYNRFIVELVEAALTRRIPLAGQRVRTEMQEAS